MTADRNEVLDAEEIRSRIASDELDWRLGDGALVKEVKGKDFRSALDYVNRVGELAERANHHPDIAISWNRVTLELSTHSAGGITGADLELAARIDELGTPAS